MTNPYWQIADITGNNSGCAINLKEIIEALLNCLQCHISAEAPIICSVTKMLTRNKPSRIESFNRWTMRAWSQMAH